MMSQSNTSFDYIVVGAGTAGCMLASRLARHGTVMLLEAGADASRNVHAMRPAEYLRLQESEIDWSYQTRANEQLAGRSLRCPRGRALGGSSVINAMIYCEGEPEDYVRWHEAGGDSWSPDAIQQAFSRLRIDIEGRFSVQQPRDLSSSCEAFLDAADSAIRGGDVTGCAMTYRRTQRQGVRCSAAVLLNDAPPETITIATGCHVHGISWDQDRATGVRIGNTAQETIAANRAVVLSAGAIGTPHLLMLSGIGPTETLREVGIESHVDAPEVGENLVDHLAYPVLYEVQPQRRFPGQFSMRDLARWNCVGTGPIASNLAEVGGFFDIPKEVGVSERDRTRGIQLHVTPTHYLRHPDADAPAAMSIAVTGSQPQSRGRVTIVSKDACDHPVIDPNYLDHQFDRDVMVAGVQIARCIAERSPLRHIIVKESLPGSRRDSPTQVLRSIRRYGLSLYHPVGTCRMGQDPLSVVDTDFAVRGRRGLYVADASVFPSIPHANPNAMVMLVAYRAADRIAQITG